VEATGDAKEGRNTDKRAILSVSVLHLKLILGIILRKKGLMVKSVKRIEALEKKLKA